MTEAHRPPPWLALTLGDPAGIGLEIALKALPRLEPALRNRLLLYGHAASLEAERARLRALGITSDQRPLCAITSTASLPTPAQASQQLTIVDVGPDDHPEAVPLGVASRPAAQIQYASLTHAIDDALEHRVAGLVTAPWTKHALELAGLPPTGHTEVLTQRSASADTVMLLAGEVLRVALVTAHLPLREVADALSRERIVAVVQKVDEAGRLLYGIARPRIAICGLNPHAGERGILGEEDEAIIAPAVRELRSRGIEASGPHPADTLFARVVRKQSADFVVAMYHDQGLAPLKLWHQGEAANITLGLPFVRTSVDHGTAYDIAGQGVASSESLEYAVRLAGRFVDRSAR